MSLFWLIPKPKGILKFRQNQISAKTAKIRPKTETESVSVVPYIYFSSNGTISMNCDVKYILKDWLSAGNKPS